MQKVIAMPTTASIGHSLIYPSAAVAGQAIAYSLMVNLFPVALAVTPSQRGKAAPGSRVTEPETFPTSRFLRGTALTPARILSARRTLILDALVKRIRLFLS